MLTLAGREKISSTQGSLTASDTLISYKATLSARASASNILRRPGSVRQHHHIFLLRRLPLILCALQAFARTASVHIVVFGTKLAQDVTVACQKASSCIRCGDGTGMYPEWLA